MGETEATLLTVKGVTDVQMILKNSGVNTMNYRVQEYNGSAWSDLDESGTDMYNTLTANQTRLIQISADHAHIQIVGNASGGAYLEISAQTETTRSSGGSFTVLPI